MKYLALLRGVNVGGKNVLPMSQLKDRLKELGFTDVSTYIASGNVIIESNKPASEIQTLLEEELPKRFRFDDGFIKILVLTRVQLQAVIDNKPDGFGDHPETYHSDAIFLMGIDTARAMSVFNPREGVDRIWPGDGVIYSQRLSSQRTKSRLNRIMAAPEYKSMTIRNWSTTTELLKLLGK
jgi:uncharacterized protein (DUF1697 family)